MSDDDVHYDPAEFHAAQREEFDAEELAVQRALEDHELMTGITALLNKRSRENRSNTPDFILSALMMSALDAYERMTATRDAWYGIAPSPGRTAPAHTQTSGLDDDGLRYRLWSIKKGAWWRRNEFGYTSDPNDAGQYTRPEALKRVAQSALSGRRELVTCMVVVQPVGGAA
jgi:hypothetical protein